jgi:hypothetical protein
MMSDTNQHGPGKNPDPLEFLNVESMDFDWPPSIPYPLGQLVVEVIRQRVARIDQILFELQLL